MNKPKQMWLCLEDGITTRLITIESLLEGQKDITIKALKETFKEYKLKLLIA